MRDSRRFAAGTVVLALVAFWFVPPAEAAELLSVKPMPSEVELSVGESATGVLVLANTSKTTLRRVRVGYAGAGGSVRLRLRNRKGEIPGNGAVVVIFRAARVSEGSGKAVNIQIVASYRVLRARHVTLSTLVVKPLPPVSLVEANIESKVETINENRSGEGALILKNPRESSLRVDEVQIRAPEDVTIALSCENGKPSLETAEATTETFNRKQIRDCRGRARVQARSQEVLPLTFSARDSVAPGHRLVLVRVRGSDPRASRSASPQTVIASTTFDVEVFGESAILKAVGVPVFLLLPGVIVIAVLWFLLTQVYPRRRVAGGDGGVPKLLADIDTKVEKVSVAAIAGVGVSLLIALIYPWLTARWYPGDERNYLRGYGFRDFYYVFGYSFVIAGAVWFLLVLLFLGRRAIRWLFVLSEGDEPVDVLRKLGLSSLCGSELRRLGWDTAMGSTKLPRVAFGEGQGRRALRLKRRKECVLVTPTINVELTSRASETLAREIEDCISHDHPVRLWLKLRTAKWKRQAILGFQSSGSLEGPELKPGVDLRQSGQFGPVAALAVQQ